ncbi:MAG TPA: 16S rRNA (cytidine(1402)-2'-O)-methyltransferase [Actinomycetota bacterium]|nr:16S rRNA (cytidine(1402)-2'-O)-methyltransferase [Actinomycetota bacterium]
MAGTLWLVGTPIGNLGDITERARNVLRRADLIACEDTRRTRALLSHLGIEGKRLVSFFEANEERRIPELLGRLRDGRDVAVVSDAGMPVLSDPGYRLVAACVEQGLPVDVVPGPSAAVAALVVSGLPTDRFAFEGFLPRKAGARRARLAELADDPRTLVLFESPRRVASLLREAAAELGPERPAAVARELTKLHQEVVRGTLGDLVQRFGREELRGEIVVVIAGAPERAAPDFDRLGEEVERLTEEGLSRREAVDRVAGEAGASRRQLYEASLRRRPK